MNDISFELGLDPLDTDLWAEACLACETTDNHGNGLCMTCDD